MPSTTPEFRCPLYVSFIPSFTFLLCWNIHILLLHYNHLILPLSSLFNPPSPFMSGSLISDGPDKIKLVGLCVTLSQAVLFMDRSFEASSYDAQPHSSKCGFPQKPCQSLLVCLYLYITDWNWEATTKKFYHWGSERIWWEWTADFESNINIFSLSANDSKWCNSQDGHMGTIQFSH